MVVSNFHEAEKSHSSRMKSILETAVSLSPPDHLAPRTESSVSLLAARHDPDAALREQTAAALLTGHLPIIVLDQSSERPPSESHDLQSDRSLILLLIGSSSDDPADALQRATQAGDWAWAARALVRSLAVPRILAGADGAVVRQIVEFREFGESEPLLLAAAAVAHSWFDLAESALARAASELNQAAQPDATELVSLMLLSIAMARQQGDAVVGLAQAGQLNDLMVKLTASERSQAPELSPLIDYYVAGFELLRGNVDSARWTLERGAGRVGGSRNGDATDAEQLARAACAGQLSWIDAFCGDLGRATRYATSVLTDRQADASESGVRFAHLATAWTHLERGEVEQARQRLDHAVQTCADDHDPLLRAAQALTQARLATITDDPETTLRLLSSTGRIDSQIAASWFADRLLIARAEAWLAAGEPQQAIATLTPEPELAPAEARSILTRSLLRLGDLPAAEMMLALIPSDPVVLTVATQVQRWLLVAQLAVEQGNFRRAELLVDRALRVATREQLRMTVAMAGGWLRSIAVRDSDMSARHSAFLASVPEPTMNVIDHRLVNPGAYDPLFVAPLTMRETDVLKRLAEYCSNEEIAADLVLSLNTVKTHMRSLFQKLSVTRRADAVRRGRALGLC